jgi:alpha-galactosidase
MRFIRFSTLALLAASACGYAADLTGNWLVKQASPDGNVRETYFDLTRDGQTITGAMRSVTFDRKIQTGTIDADGKIVLTVQGQNNRPGQRIQAKFVNGELRVSMPMRGGTGEEIAATRAPAGVGGPPAKIPPPALHKVPYNGLAKTPPMGWNSWNKSQAA